VRTVGVLILAVLFVKGCLIPGLKVINQSSLCDTERKEKNDKYSGQYLSFFKDEVKSKMVIEDNFSVKTKANYTRVSFEDYFIFIHIVDVNKKFSLPASVILEKKKVGITPDAPYGGVSEGSLEFNYSFESLEDKPDKLFIAYDKLLISPINESDSLMNFNFQAQTMSYRYSSNGTADMVFSCLREELNLSFNIVILRKDDQAVIMTAVPKNKNVKANPALIRDLLREN
jgi:hypothetical protein